MYISGRWIKDVISQKDIESKSWLEWEICWAIQNWWDASESATSLKRNFHYRLDEATKQLHNDDDMEYDLLYSQKKAFIAMFKSEWLSPAFVERDYYDRDAVKALNKVAEFDIENMNKNTRDLKMLSDVYDYGVWLRVYNGFDKVNKCPIIITPSPLSRYYDPQGNAYDMNFDFHLFEYQTSRADLEYQNAISWWYFWLDEVASWTYSRNDSTLKNKNLRLQNNDNLNDDEIYIHNCFITMNWHRYFCILANDLTKIIKRERLLPITKEEKADGTLVPFKISITNSSIDQYDARWVSYREKVFPVQISLTKLVNAIESKQLRDAWHDVILYDVDKIENVHDLSLRPDWWPLFVPVTDLWTWPATSPVFEQNDTSKSTQYLQQLEMYAERTTSLTGITRWLAPTTWTLWETEIQLQKSNNLFSVDAQMLNAWESFFRKNIYFRSMRENFSKIWEKTIVLWVDNNDIVTLKKEDFLWKNTPHVTIYSKRKQEDEKSKKVWAMQAMLPLITQDPNVSPISVKLFKRELMKLQWLDDGFIMSVEPYTPSERHSKNMVSIVNSWITPQNMLIPWLDLETLRIYLQSAVENEEKAKAINLLNAKMVKEWLWQPKVAWSESWLWWIANSMWAQSLSNEIAQRQNQQETI